MVLEIVSSRGLAQFFLVSSHYVDSTDGLGFFNLVEASFEFKKYSFSFNRSLDVVATVLMECGMSFSEFTS